MIRHRATVGLSLCIAVLVCGFTAQSAFGATATNTTAVTCVPFSTGFSDAHCNEKVSPGFGAFGHEEIPTGEKTSITSTNAETSSSTTELTPAVLKGTVFGVKLEITCLFAEGSGTIENTQSENKHTVKGNIHASFWNCSVQKPSKCAVGTITVNADFVAVEGLGPEKNTMGVEFKPPSEGSKFVAITLGNSGAESCALKGKPFNVEGTAIATGAPSPTAKHTGSTAIFTNEMTKETLKVGGAAAEFATSMAAEMFIGDPIALTTTT